MEQDQQSSQPMGQPINPNPSDPQYAPQPLGDQPLSSQGKGKWLAIAGGLVVAMLLLGGLVWWMTKGAKEGYVQAVQAYQQDIKDQRDALNEEMDNKNIGGSDSEAPPLFEEHGKKLQEIVAKAPKEPKVFGFIPVSVTAADKEKVAKLSEAATHYANALRENFTIFNYYTVATEEFKPIKDLGTITARDEGKIKEFATLWPEYQTTFEAIKPPQALESLHADLIAQNKVIGEKIAHINANYSTNSLTATDALMSELSKLTKTLNQTFTRGVVEAADAALDTVNTAYDALDELLK